MTLVITNADFLSGDILAGQTVDNPIIFYQSFYTIADISSSNSLGGGSSSSNPPLNLWNPDTSSLWFGNGTSPGPERLYEEYIIIEKVCSRRNNQWFVIYDKIINNELIIRNIFDCSKSIISCVCYVPKSNFKTFAKNVRINRMFHRSNT